MTRSISLKSLKRKGEDLITLIGLVFIAVGLAGRLLPIPFTVGVVASSSMEPTLTPGDLVIAYGKDVRVGDIVIYCLSLKACIVHRVIRVYDSMIITKGDALKTPDPPVPKGKVRGKVVFVVPWYIWIPPFTAYVILMSGNALRKLAEGAEWHPYITFLVLFVVSILLSHSEPWVPPKPPMPHIALSIFDFESCKVIVKIAYNGSIEEVYNVSSGWRLVMFNATHVLFSPANTTELRVAALSASCVPLSFSAKLTRNITIDFTGCLHVPSKPPSVIIRCPQIKITNPNCYPLSVKLVYYGIVEGVYRVVSREAIVVSPKETKNITVPKGVVYVDINGVRYACGQTR